MASTTGSSANNKVFQVFKPGEIFDVRDEIKNSILSRYSNKKPQFIIGIAVQEEHTQRKIDAGFLVSTFKDHCPFDRICNNTIEDDKCSLIVDGKESQTHTIGISEIPFWKTLNVAGVEVIINSFSQVSEDNWWSFKFNGTYLYSKLNILESKFNNTSYFYKHTNTILEKEGNIIYESRNA